jgi:hypothetical protein
MLTITLGAIVRLILASRSATAGAPMYNLGGDAVHLDDWVRAIENAVPEAAGLITVGPGELPFPDDIAHDRLAELGAITVTPHREAIATTTEIYRRLAQEGRLVGSEHGVATARAVAVS